MRTSLSHSARCRTRCRERLFASAHVEWTIEADVESKPGYIYFSLFRA